MANPFSNSLSTALIKEHFYLMHNVKFVRTGIRKETVIVIQESQRTTTGERTQGSITNRNRKITHVWEIAGAPCLTTHNQNNG